MSKVSSPADLISLPMEMVHARMDLRVSSLMPACFAVQERRRGQATCPRPVTTHAASKCAYRLGPGRRAFELSADARILAAARRKGS
eukprot:2511835-Pleurochrysis_carterae.AAC.1